MAVRKKPMVMSSMTPSRAPAKTVRATPVKRSAAVARPAVRRKGAAVAVAKNRGVAAGGVVTPRNAIPFTKPVPGLVGAHYKMAAAGGASTRAAAGRAFTRAAADEKPAEPSKAAINRIRSLAKKNGKTLTEEQIKARAARQTRIDKEGGGAQRFDFAGDGAYTKDKDFGSKKNNQRRAFKGKDRANVKGADKYGTGKRFTDKQKEKAKEGYSIGKKKDDKGKDDTGSGGDGKGGGVGDPFPNGQQDGDPNGGGGSGDQSAKMAKERGSGPPGSPGRVKYEEEQRLRRRRRRAAGRS